MLQQLGAFVKFTHTYVLYSTDQKIYWVALILHFSFSIFFAYFLIYMAQYNKTKWIAMWMVPSMGFLFGLYGILFLWLLGYSI